MSQKYHAPNIKLYMIIFGILMVLTVVTVLASYWDLPKGPAILLGLFIATVKASLVAAFFMHLKGERMLIYSMLGLTIVFMLVLFAVPILDSSLTSDTRISHPVSASSDHGH